MRVISHQSVATVRPPRRGESASPRGADARRTRARERRETTDRFFSHSSRPRRDRGFARGRRARGARRRVLGRSRVSPRFYPHARVRSAWVIPARRVARVAERSSVVPERCVAERSLSIHAFRRSFARVGGRVRDARSWDASGLIDSRAHRERTTVWDPPS